MQVLVVGLGYVGSVVAAGLARAGHAVTGIDTDIEKIESLGSGLSRMREPGLADLIQESIDKQHLKLLPISEINQIDQPIVFICVGTPTRADGSVDLTQVTDAVKWAVSKAKDPVIIVMKSTVPPGTGVRIKNQYLDQQNPKHAYIMNPEFLQEGQAIDNWSYPDRHVLGGDDEIAIKQICKLYENRKAPILITDVTTAEIIKYAANAFLATKISFINEIAKLCEQTDGDIDIVAKGIGLDKRIGPGFLRAGLGYGGSCFPKDTRALDSICADNGIDFELIKAVIKVNNEQRMLAIGKLKNALGNLDGKRVAILGLAFKPGTDDIREAPSLDIIRLLLKEGVEIKAYDPAAISNARAHLPAQVNFCHNALEALTGANAAILVTEWDEFIDLNWKTAKEKMKDPFVIIDGRNCLAPSSMKNYGFNYNGFGRAK